MSEALNTILTAVVVPVIVALVPFLINYLNKLAEEVKSRMKDKALQKYVDIAEDAIQTSVLAVMQTYVDSIKSNPNLWTKEAQTEAFNMAKLQAVAIMGTAARTALKEIYEDFDTWLDAKIEQYVALNKSPG